MPTVGWKKRHQNWIDQESRRKRGLPTWTIFNGKRKYDTNHVSVSSPSQNPVSPSIPQTNTFNRNPYDTLLQELFEEKPETAEIKPWMQYDDGVVRDAIEKYCAARVETMDCSSPFRCAIRGQGLCGTEFWQRDKPRFALGLEKNPALRKALFDSDLLQKAEAAGAAEVNDDTLGLALDKYCRDMQEKDSESMIPENCPSCKVRNTGYCDGLFIGIFDATPDYQDRGESGPRAKDPRRPKVIKVLKDAGYFYTGGSD